MTSPTTLYRLYGPQDELFYVGITDSPTGRFTTHACEKLWWDEIVTIRLEHYPTRQEAEKAELAAILAEQPIYNAAFNERNPRRRSGGYRGWRLPRGACAVCGSDQAVYPNGLIARHHSADRRDGRLLRYGPCPGALRPVEGI